MRLSSTTAGRLVAAAAFFSALHLPDAGSAAARGGPHLVQPAPNFSLRDRHGELVSLADLAFPGEERRGRVRRTVLLDFFRTDCKPCVKALPELVKLHERLSPRGLRVLLIALLVPEEGEEMLTHFFAANPVPFPVLVDRYELAAKRYVLQKGGLKIPALFLIDRFGVLRERFLRLDEKAVARIEEVAQ